MKKIQRNFLFVCFLILFGFGQAYSQDPVILCPSDITLSIDEDYTDTEITGTAEAFSLNGAEEVEYNDIIVNINDGLGFARRRWNVVDRSDIFCDQTITIEDSENQDICKDNLSASITSSSVAGAYFPMLDGEDLLDAPEEYTTLKVSRDGVYFHDFITFDCCDVGMQTFYGLAEDSEGNTLSCTNQILIEDEFAPAFLGGQIQLGLYGASAELTLDMLNRHFLEYCSIAEATFSQSIFTSVGEYDVDFTVADEAGNITEGTISVNVTDVNGIVCNQNINVSLNDQGIAVITPDMVAESVYPAANGEQKISINDGPFSDEVILDCDDIGSLNFTLQDVTGNSCWGMIELEDKLAPILSVPDVVYLTLNVPTEALLTTDMLDRYTYDNCGLASQVLSQGLFASEGTYDVTYTVEDDAGNQTSQDFVVIVTSGSIAPACNDKTEVILNDEGQATIDYFQQLEGNIYLNGNFTVGISDFPDDAEEFFNSIDLDCSHIGKQLTLAVKDEFSGNTCWGQLSVLDNTPPIPYALSSITVYMDDNEPYVLDPELLDNGSFDNCSDVALTVTPNTFTSPGIYEVKLRAYDSSGNSDFVKSTVIVEQENEENPLECIGLSTALTNPFGPTRIYAVDFVTNPDNFDSFSMTTDINGTYTEYIDFDCSEYPTGEAFSIYVRGEANGEFSYCSMSLTLIDNIPPVAVAEQIIVLELVNGQATLTPEDVDDGSYDLCGDVSLTLSQTTFNSTHIGWNQVTLTVIDAAGNSNTVITDVQVIDDNNGNPCSIDYVIFPEDITINDSDGTYENLSIENLQAVYNYSYEEVHPYTVAECDALAYAYEDVVFPSDNIIKVVRTFTVLDWFTSSIKTETQIIKIIKSNSTLSCLANLTINISTGVVQVFPQDVLAGDNYDFSTIELTISLNVDPIAGNIITPNYIGQTLNYQVVDTLTGNSCWGTITVVDDQEGCPLDPDEDVTYPLESIYLANSNIDPSEYEPEDLVSNFGFAEADVNVIIDSDCAIAASVFEDQVFNYIDGNFKIIRTFTILDWISYDPQSSEGVYTFVQTIHVGVDPNTLICDVLPNSAPVGDCDTGHTLEDDVEWPSDISISDYNITPEELIENSGIEEKDAMPIFFNNPDDYTVSYIDLVLDLNPTTLTIARVWKAEHTTYNISWNYSQTIEIDFTEFQNLVTVNTATDRAVPGVIINDTFMTNDEGHAQVPSAVLSIDFDDEVLNGVNVRDLILIQRHILGMETLDERLILAADANNDNQIKSSDVFNFSKRILGETNELEWEFVNSVDQISSITKPRAKYTAYKKGDVDDSAILPGEDLLTPTSSITITDKVLNNGETYLIPVSVEDISFAKGIEVRLGVNTDLIDIVGIENNLLFDYENFNVNDEELVILMYNFLEDADISQSTDQAVVYIELKAKANTLLSNAISVEDRFSYLVDENIDLNVLGGEIDNVITGNNSTELASIKVYPNPTSDYLIVDMNDLDVKGDFSVTIINAQGQIMTRQNTNTVDVQSYIPGVYYYEVQIGEYEKKGKFLVIR